MNDPGAAVVVLADRLAPGLDGRAARLFIDLSRDHPWLADAARVVDQLGHPNVMRVALVGAALVALRAGSGRRAVAAVAAMVVGGFLGLGLKRLIARPRAAWDDPVLVAPDSSMPSGHALNAALCTGLVVVVLWPRLSRRARTWSLVAAGAVTATVCLDRLLLGVHYLSDVSVGALIGGCLAALTGWLLRERTGGRRLDSGCDVDARAAS